MKRVAIISLILSLVSIVSQAHTYVSSSCLSSGNIVKLQIPSTGIYCLTYEQIQAYGLQPDKIRVLGYGGNLINQDFTKRRVDDVPSIPFYMYVGSDGVFSPGDYILFYANGPVGWDWSGSYFKRTQNCYADYGCYFISDSAGPQNILSLGTTPEGAPQYDVHTYTALQLHELDQRNLMDVNRGEEGGGREWYGEILNQSSNTLTIPFEFNDVDVSKTLFCRVDAAATSSSMTTLEISLAGQSKKDSIQAIEGSDFYSRAKTKTILVYNIYPTGNSLPVKLKYIMKKSTDVAYLNYIEMQVPCSLRLRDNYLLIRNTEHVGETNNSRYHLQGADANTQVWNITKPDSAYIVPTEWLDDALCWIGSNLSPELYVAVRTDAGNWPTPASRGKVVNQNLHQKLRGVQHVIVTPEAFREPAERLKQAHEEQRPSQKWCVVSDEEVYNEFSSGTPDASAIRWMMKYLWDTYKETSDAPKSVLLFGDGTFDNRQILTTSGQATLLTYQAHNSTVETYAYATDDYFGWMEDNAGMVGSYWEDKRARMQIGVGRLPVNTYEEAEQVVDKLSSYMNNENAGNWKQQVCFLADDGNNGMHVTTADIAAQLVRAQSPEYILNKIYLDAYEQESSASGESYPLALNTYTNLLQTGVLMMDYAGHGSANNICSEMFLTRKQVENMKNTNQGLWILATCNFAHFDMKEKSTAEVSVLNPYGGAIAVMSSDRTVYASDNEILNKYFCENLFMRDSDNTYPYTIGEALRLAKNKNGDNMNKLPFVLLGDPSLQLNYPQPYQIEITEMPDTLRALDLVVIRGRVLCPTFNGNLSISVFDKEQTVFTKDNDEPDETKKVIRSFQDFPNKLFVGGADVVDGKFIVEFRMPKDIRYNVDKARLALYAVGYDTTGPAEALGYSESFDVGGSSPWEIDDTQGPDMQIYLNSPSFRSGEEVNPAPRFYADLFDENGINTVGSGIGHDLLLIVDNSVKQSYILNNYYTSTNNSYKEGKVSYLLPQLADGSHTLSFRAWDMLNNATTKNLGFTVNTDLGPDVKELIVYPNPVSHSGELNMYIRHDRPDERLKMNVSFYNLMGQPIWSTSSELLGSDYDATATIDMSQTLLPTGTYIYQFIIETTTQSSKRYTGRIIVY